ncbi:MAG TPA: hypothetical protein VIL98_11320 [Gaiellaceae bacterium]
MAEDVTAERLAYEREFWSTFGEEGVCVFWGVSGTALKHLDGAVRGVLVGFTNDVGRRPEEERDRLLAEVSSVPEDGRLPHLCELAAAYRIDQTSARTAGSG